MSRKHLCPYCGDAQASHIFLWWDACIDILLAKLPPPEYFFSFFVSTYLLERILNAATAISLFPLQTFGLVRFHTTLSDSTSPRIRALWRAATERGYVMEQASIFGIRSELCRVAIKDSAHKMRWSYFSMLPNIFPAEFVPTADIDNKQIFTRLLTSAGIPTPRGGAFLRMAPAMRFFHTLNAPAIVKPQKGSRARHTTIAIRTPEALRAAIRKARAISPWVVVQEFIEGDLYRATCVGGMMVGVIRFIKPTVIADGTHTVRELLDMHNAHKKHPTMTDVKDDVLFAECLGRQSLTESSCPERGTTILLAEHSERPNGGYFVDCTDAIPYENKAIVERAARLLRSPVIGFDILSRDFTKPMSNEPFAFIEGNCAPFIELHDIPFEGKPRDVAAAVWELWEECRGHRKRHNREP